MYRDHRATIPKNEFWMDCHSQDAILRLLELLSFNSGLVGRSGVRFVLDRFPANGTRFESAPALGAEEP